MPAAAADDDGAQAAPRGERIERRQERLDQRAVIGIVALRPVEHDLRHAAAVNLAKHRRVAVRLGHGTLQAWIR
jgi:hypothetical protein